MATCKGCGLGPCSWGLEGRKWHLLEPDGSRHRCLNYRTEKKVREPAHQAGPRIVGAGYSQSCQGCSVPPWEDCHNCPGSAADRSNAEADAGFTRMLDLAGQA